jgi:hypothetical protein
MFTRMRNAKADNLGTSSMASDAPGGLFKWREGVGLLAFGMRETHSDLRSITTGNSNYIDTCILFGLMSTFYFSFLLYTSWCFRVERPLKFLVLESWLNKSL